ncbi:MAG: methyl-accepting chemotaxis protein [Treponema sp.]|jgi:methyl-accepting chemotaxis protein|nr:methyl-accepting chemotaxis protein [Treponema sp.]
MKFFNNLSIGGKFLCSSLFIVGVLTVICWLSINTIENCHHACGLLLNGAVNTKSLAQSAQTSFYALTETANQSLLYARLGDSAKSAELTRKFNADAAALNASLDTVLRALNADPLVDKSIIGPLSAQADSAKATLNNGYAPLINRLTVAQGEYEQEAAAAAVADIARSAAFSQQIADAINTVFQGISTAGNNVYTGYVDFLLGTILKLKIFVIIAVVISIILVLFLAAIIRKPFQKMMNTLAEIAAQWDMTKQFDSSSKDEIGKLAAFCNLTFEKMKELLLVIKQMSLSLTDTGTNLTSNAYQTASSINEITASIQSIKEQVITQASEVNQTGSAMERIMSQVDTLNEHIAVQAASVNQSSSSIEEMLDNIHTVAETLAKNAANITTLSDASEVGKRDLQIVSEDIQEIARESEGLLEINAVIQNIASQTNLLSMNAAIEAAHAGEVGKGFAVVADEIRKLAENSSEQSKIIGEVLKKIKVSIDAIGKSTGVMIKGFETIEEGVQTVSDQEAAIRTAMEEQETGSRNIFEEVTKLKNITGLVESSSAKIAVEGKEIKRQSTDLERITDEIQNGMKEISTGADLIVVAVNQVNDISGTNKRNIDTLSTEIAKFKVE